MRLFDISHHVAPHWLSLVTADDAVLLRQEAVYLMKTTAIASLPCALYCLYVDAAVRGITISEPFTALDDRQWLDLVLITKQHL